MSRAWRAVPAIDLRPRSAEAAPPHCSCVRPDDESPQPRTAPLPRTDPAIDRRHAPGARPLPGPARPLPAPDLSRAGGTSSPRSYATATAAARSFMPSFAYRWSRCERFGTVRRSVDGWRHFRALPGDGSRVSGLSRRPARVSTIHRRRGGVWSITVRGACVPPDDASPELCTTPARCADRAIDRRGRAAEPIKAAGTGSRSGAPGSAGTTAERHVAGGSRG